LSALITDDTNQLTESIEIIIKITLEKALKSNSLTFFEKAVLLGVKEFHGLHDDLKVI